VLYVGTAGFSYADWRGVFYPENIKSEDFLTYYSEHFPFVELDYTYYRQPSASSMQKMAAKVPDNFKFTVKAHRTMTHEIPSREDIDLEFDVFKQGILPMRDSGKLACVLFQFPWSFKPSTSNVQYVLSLKERMPYSEVVVEFRNSLWASQDTCKYLSGKGIGFCCMDEPDLRGLFPRVSWVTSEIGYLRFHGRNKEKWFNHKETTERYDYLYSDDELKSWLPGILEMVEKSKDMYVVFNNCHRGQAATNALRMKEMLKLPLE